MNSSILFLFLFLFLFLSLFLFPLLLPLFLSFPLVILFHLFPRRHLSPVAVPNDTNFLGPVTASVVVPVNVVPHHCITTLTYVL